jgi:hypothetical protein
LYVGGRVIDQPDAVVAYEPGVFGATRYALYADGAVRRVALDAIIRSQTTGAPR